MTHHKDDNKQAGAEQEDNNDTSAPFLPSKGDKTPLGDTDQHSKVAGGKTVPAEEGITANEHGQ